MKLISSNLFNIHISYVLIESKSKIFVSVFFVSIIIRDLIIFIFVKIILMSLCCYYGYDWYIFLINNTQRVINYRRAMKLLFFL